MQSLWVTTIRHHPPHIYPLSTWHHHMWLNLSGLPFPFLHTCTASNQKLELRKAWGWCYVVGMTSCSSSYMLRALQLSAETSVEILVVICSLLQEVITLWMMWLVVCWTVLIQATYWVGLNWIQLPYLNHSKCSDISWSALQPQDTHCDPPLLA